MTKKRQVYSNEYLLAFVISTILFIIIFLFSFAISYLNYGTISSENNLIKVYIYDLKGILESSTNQDRCNLSILTESSEKLDHVGSLLSLLEIRLGVDDPRVLEQKKLYSGLEYEHFEIVKFLNEKCDQKFTTILFFYPGLINKKEDYKKISDETATMSFILGTFKNEDPERIMIYSFDYNLDSEFIDSLKEKYDVPKPPIILVNEEDYIYLKNIREVEVYLNQSNTTNSQ